VGTVIAQSKGLALLIAPENYFLATNLFTNQFARFQEGAVEGQVPKVF